MLTPRITEAEVNNVEGMFSIRWATSPAAHPVSIALYEAPSTVLSPLSPLARNLCDGQLALGIATSRQRQYFVLCPEGGSPVTVAERVLPLQGARNFRDLGGYATRSGRRVRWGQLYRSDYLVHLTEEDCDYIRSIGLRTVFDLRGNMERSRYPSRWHPEASVATICWEDAHDVEKLGQRLQKYRQTNQLDQDQGMHGFLSEHYRRYLDVQAEKYRAILARLVAAETAPALIHCTAGKDRTGIIAALVLYLLGVDEATIMQDYLLTNEYVKGPDEQERFRLLLSQFGLDDISDRVVDAMLYAHAEYLQAAFDGMREDYGSVENYAAQKLGFDEQMTQRLRSRYLE